jgi:hypothetical protein
MWRVGAGAEEGGEAGTNEEEESLREGLDRNGGGGEGWKEGARERESGIGGSDVERQAYTRVYSYSPIRDTITAANSDSYSPIRETIAANSDTDSYSPIRDLLGTCLRIIVTGIRPCIRREPTVADHWRSRSGGRRLTKRCYIRPARERSSKQRSGQWPPQ